MVMVLACVVCKQPATELHHVITRQELRHHAQSRRRPNARTFAQLAADRRNLVPLCDQHHDNHHSRQADLDVRYLPTAAITFAEEVLGRHPAHVYLSRRYTGLDEDHRCRALVAA